MPPRPAMIAPHASNLDQRGRPGRAGRSQQVIKRMSFCGVRAQSRRDLEPSEIILFRGRMPSECSRRGPEASEGPAASTGDVAADGGQAYGRASVPSPESCACPRIVQCRSLPESCSWQCGIALLDFEDLRTANAEPVNVVRAGYDQEMLEGGALANFRETVIARGAAGLRLDRLLSPL